MMNDYIDIRRVSETEIKHIVFADPDDNYVVATRISKLSDGIVAIEERDTNDRDAGDDVRLVSAEQGRNLIKAIEKAIEMKWLK